MLAVFISPGTASATTTVANCNGKTLVSTNYVKIDDSDANAGAIQLCRDGSNWFGMYISYGAMPANHAGQAFIYRNYDGNIVDHFDCDSAGGNGYVKAGQTWCKTPNITGPNSRYTFQATGSYNVLQSGQWVLAGGGWTKRCNQTSCV